MGLVRRAADKAAEFFARRIIDSAFERTSSATRASLLTIYTQYRMAALDGRPLPPIAECGFRVFSQTEEDGTLLRIFGAIGMETQTFVEFGSGDGLENNTANLCLNFGWYGLMIDGDPNSIARARRFHARAWNATSWQHPPLIDCQMVSPENVNKLLAEAGLRGNIDLLSIDIDSCDYFVWEAIQGIRPRVVVIEANAAFGDRSVVVPYAGSPTRHIHTEYYGASLAALTSLGHRLGYKLVAVNRLGFNAFFVQRDLCGTNLPEFALPLAWKHPFTLKAEERFEELARYPLQTIARE
jgi:hypothetical protein